MSHDPAHFASWEDAVAWLVSQPDKQDIVQAGYYDSPLIGAATRFWHSAEWTSVRTYLPTRKGTALDVGAGRGIASFALAKDGWKVTALEPDPSSLVGTGAIKSLASETSLPISVTQEFGERLPFPDASFDLVFARQVLHHARDLSKLCSEISRVLRPGGTFIAVRDHVLQKKSHLQRFLDSHPLHHLYGGENAYLLSEYRQAIADAGLVVDKMLRSFETQIHYDLEQIGDIRTKIEQRMQKIPLGKPLASALLTDRTLRVALKVFARFDARPGSAVSFICHKPGNS